MFISDIKVSDPERRLTSALSDLPPSYHSWAVGTSKKQALITDIYNSLSERYLKNRKSLRALLNYPKLQDLYESAKNTNSFYTHGPSQARPLPDLYTITTAEFVAREIEREDARGYIPAWAKHAIAGVEGLMESSVSSSEFASHWPRKLPKFTNGSQNTSTAVASKLIFIPTETEEKTEADLQATGDKKIMQGGNVFSSSGYHLSKEAVQRVVSHLTETESSRRYQTLYRYFRGIQRGLLKSSTPIVVDTIPAVQISIPDVRDLSLSRGYSGFSYLSLASEEGLTFKGAMTSLKAGELNTAVSQLPRAVVATTGEMAFTGELAFTGTIRAVSSTAKMAKEEYNLKTKVKTGILVVISVTDLLFAVPALSPTHLKLGAKQRIWVPPSRMDIEGVMAMRNKAPLLSWSKNYVKFTEHGPELSKDDEDGVFVQAATIGDGGDVTDFAPARNLASESGVFSKSGSFRQAKDTDPLKEGISKSFEILLKGGITNRIPEELDSVDIDHLSFAAGAVALSFPVPGQILAESLSKIWLSLFRKMETKNVLLY